jgi:hypothetical protein
VFAVATAIYWYHVYGRAELDVGAVQASVVAAGVRETGVFQAMLVREALRRLATPLVLAAEAGTTNAGVLASAAFGQRLRAVDVIMRSWDPLRW